MLQNMQLQVNTHFHGLRSFQHVMSKVEWTSLVPRPCPAFCHLGLGIYEAKNGHWRVLTTMLLTATSTFDMKIEGTFISRRVLSMQ